MNIQESIVYLRQFREENFMLSDIEYRKFGQIIKTLESEQAQKYSNKQTIKAYKGLI